MNTRVELKQGRLLKVMALLCVLVVSVMPRPAAALDICVQDVNDLINGWHQAEVFQSDGTVTLRVVTGTYVLNGDTQVVLGNRINLLGGYSPGCSARTIYPANTIIDGQNLFRLQLYGQGLGSTIEGIRFNNLESLDVADSQICADYGETMTFQRNIVAGSSTTAIVRSSCAPLVFQNNLAQQISSLRVGIFTNGDFAAYLTNNTIVGNAENGLQLSGQGDPLNGDSDKFYVSNNLMWGNTGFDFFVNPGFPIPVAPPVVSAWGNTWGSSNVTLTEGDGNNSLDPQLDGNGVPIAPGSPAINSGDNGPFGGLPAFDIVGSPRLIGSAVDRGAYETPVVDATDLVVTNANDSGTGSLRQAILDANSLPNFNTIRFAIPGQFGAILLPQTPYPDILAPVRIDGFTQLGALANSNQWSNNAEYRIDIAGGGTVSYAFRVPTNAPAGARLELFGLRIGGFTNAVLLQSGSNHIVRGNHFGKFSDSVLGGSDNVNSIYVNSTADSVDIGGFDPSARNSIAGHPNPPANNGFGIYLGGSGDGHVVAGNLIGTFPNGNEAHGHQVGIRIDSDLNVVASNVISGNSTGMQILGSDNLVSSNKVGMKAFAFCLPPCVPDYALPNANGALVYGGANGNDFVQNQIAYNSYSGMIVYPEALTNTLSANRVYANATLDVDLRNPAGMNPIDGDGPGVTGCTEANCDQNFPLLGSAGGLRYSGQVQGSLSTTNGDYRLEFFSGATCGAGGQGGASTYLGTHNVTVTGGSLFPPINGSATFDLPLTSSSTLYGRFITATATSPGGSTSEYSACIAYACDQIFAHDFDDTYAEICPTAP